MKNILNTLLSYATLRFLGEYVHTHMVIFNGIKACLVC